MDSHQVFANTIRLLAIDSDQLDDVRFVFQSACVNFQFNQRGKSHESQSWAAGTESASSEIVPKNHLDEKSLLPPGQAGMPQG